MARRKEYEKEAADGEVVLAHEPMFGEGYYDEGENVIVAIAHTAGSNDESPGSALERLAKQIFLLGVTHGTQTERERIISRIVGPE